MRRSLALLTALLLVATLGPPALTGASSVSAAGAHTGSLRTSTPQIQLVSINRAGTNGGSDGSYVQTISADGRFVAFSSDANDLVANDTNRPAFDQFWQRDVFVRDLQTRATTLASVNRSGTNSGNRPSGGGVLSANGRVVAFRSESSDLVATATYGQGDLFVRDLQTGITALVSVNRFGTGSGNGGSQLPQLSADGRFVAFSSSASDLVTNDTNGTSDVFVRDLQTGVTTLVSVNRAGTGSGNGISIEQSTISANGRSVGFVSSASDLVANDTNGTADVFLRDLRTGTTTLVSVDRAGTDSGNAFSGGVEAPSLSADGRFVAFRSPASDLVANDTNGRDDVFVRDLQAGTTTLVSVNRAGTGSGNGFSDGARMSADGRFVVIRSSANDLVTNDTNGGATDVFVRDLQTESTTLVSVNQAGTGSGNGLSREGVLSPNGRFVAFYGLASDLVASDTNGVGDVFVRDLQTGTTTLVSVNQAGTNSGNGGSGLLASGLYGLGLSADGSVIAFVSEASDLVAIDTNGAMDAFVAKITTNKPPSCRRSRANPATLWSHNHRLVPVVVWGVTDRDGDSVTITVTGVAQDEPVNAKGDGNTSPDAVIRNGAAAVRAERSRNGNGRVYHLYFRADDGQGGFCTGAVRVSVPYSRTKPTAIDDGPVYDSTIP